VQRVDVFHADNLCGFLLRLSSRDALALPTLEVVNQVIHCHELPCRTVPSLLLFVFLRKPQPFQLARRKVKGPPARRAAAQQIEDDTMKGILRSLGVALGGLIEREQFVRRRKGCRPSPVPCRRRSW
jgi:hypothetical protein